MAPTTRIEDLKGLVQSHRCGGHINSRKHWWKIEQNDNWQYRNNALKHLTKRDFAFPKEGDLYLSYLCTRAQRGMISYHKCTRTELRNFCKQRKIHISKRQNFTNEEIQTVLSKDDLRDVLEYGDEHATFPRFLELPAELRMMVYDHSLEVIEEPKNQRWREEAFNLEPPPITSVSRLLRQEALPVLYSSGILKIDMTKDNNYREPHTVTEFFGIAPLAIVEAVRHFEIIVSRGDRDRKNTVSWTIDLHHADNGTSYSLRRTSTAKWVPKDKRANLEEALQKMLRSMESKVESGKRLKLKRGDVYLMRKAVQSTLNE